MRVLNTVADPRLGGPQHRIHNVALGLRDRDIETAFLIPEGDDKFHETVTDDGFDSYRMPLPRIRAPSNVLENVKFLATFFWTTRRIESLLRREEFDLVHVSMTMNFQTAMAAARTNVPLVWHYNDTLTPFPVREAAGILGRRWADDRVVAADAVHDYFFSDDVDSTTIYAPVDTDQFNPESVAVDEAALRDELNLPVDLPIVGTVGNLSPIKGHEYLIRAAAQLQERGHDIVVPIVGARLDTQEDHFQKLKSLRSELGLDNRVKFLGFRSDVAQIMSLFDVFALSSVAEACPIVVLEAMAMERSVVATSVGGVPEQLPTDDHGWTVKPEDPTALADGIEAALEDPEARRRCGQNARNRVESEFSLTACVDRHESVYRDLAKTESKHTGERD